MKPVPVPGNPWGQCAKCGGPFVPQTERHRFCCGACRQQNHRDKHRKTYICPGCGTRLALGGPAAITSRHRYCSTACNQRVRRWSEDGRLMRCQNGSCPNFRLRRHHRYDDETQTWECPGCMQLQPATW